MADPKPLDDTLGDVLGDAFEACGMPREHGAVAVSNRSDLGQFQCNGALAAAKAQRRNPMAIAEDVVAALDRPETAGSEQDLPSTAIFAKLPVRAIDHPGNLS